MRIRILSDLHLEASPWAWQSAGEDLIVLAGDIADRSAVGLYRRRKLWDDLARIGIPTLYVLGNHEGYADWIPQNELRQSIEAELPANVHLLDRDHYDSSGLRFLGCTLWTDFSLAMILDPHDASSMVQAMRFAEVGITDFKYLCLAGRSPPVRISPNDMATWHGDDIAWLIRAIEAADRPTVVVTHFLPSATSISEKYAGSPLNPYFASDCRRAMKDPVRLWIHGHTHESCDYMHDSVRVVCNPRGYAEGGGNPRFTSSLIVEVTAASH